MLDETTVAWFNARWTHQMGAIDGHDIAFLATLIEAARPRTFVEIGCASGLSTAIIARLMAQAGGGQLHSFDKRDTFYVDPEKATGYLLDEAPPHAGTDVHLYLNRTSLDVPQAVTGLIDICFIDAMHQHPWPLLDTLAVLPFMAPGGLIVHHDLQMMHGRDLFALGPKIVHDQLRENERVMPTSSDSHDHLMGAETRGIRDNIFAMRLPDRPNALAWRLAQGLLIRWDDVPPHRLPPGFADAYLAYFRTHHRPGVVGVMQIAADRYIAPPPPPPKPPVADPPQPLVRRSPLDRLLGRNHQGAAQ